MIVRRFRPDDEPEIRRLLLAREAADGRAALSEHKALRLFTATEHELVAADRETVAGYAHIAHHDAAAPSPGHWAVELVVDPAAQEPEHVAGRLLGGALGSVPPDEEITLWAWRPGDIAAAAEHRMREIRALYEMRRELPITERAPLPAGIKVTRFVPGRDEEAWLAANNAAFAKHRENGALDLANLRARMERPWFDADGFLLAWAGEELVGSCWTKLHPGALGEIYIIGVVPTFQGRGLGTSLVEEALHDLHERQHADRAMLYVDAADVPAVEFYRNLGFDVAFTNREFARD